MSFIPASSYSKEEILKCSRGDLFGPGNAKLPAPNMLMIDRIVTINNTGGSHGLGEIIAEIDITADLWFFKCHFEGDPVDLNLALFLTDTRWRNPILENIYFLPLRPILW